MNTRETFRLGWTGIVLTVFAVLAIIIGTLMYNGALPYMLGLEREAVQNSRQYVESKQQSLLTLVTEYQSAEKQIAQYEAANTANKYDNVIDSIKLQQKALLVKINNEADMIPADGVPQSVREFLARHRG